MDGHQKGNKYEFWPAPDAPYSNREHKVHNKAKTHLNTLPACATLELTEYPSSETKQMEQASSCECWFTARVPGYTPPSFKSFAISRTYKVKVKLGIDVGGKRFEYEVESEMRHMGSAPV
ncbi:hypothetical protein EK21DRAFT_68896 [Setomelanomma holmii]|uniref:Arrestin-like N-terminal domain-containing protein n=1 Tax=Setomelanomma holmii TaxID=210430 RepID=A0A9P4H8G3_9PLEO|nr:hypothetical protein EK21DRAFT_68896 [Setomelanomma holmii]